MLYVKSPELKNLGIDAAGVFEQLAEEHWLREVSGNWHIGIYCYACSDTLDKTLFVEDMEPGFSSSIGSVLRVSFIS